MPTVARKVTPIMVANLLERRGVELGNIAELLRLDLDDPQLALVVRDTARLCMVLGDILRARAMQS